MGCIWFLVFFAVREIDVYSVRLCASGSILNAQAYYEAEDVKICIFFKNYSKNFDDLEFLKLPNYKLNKSGL